MLDRKTNIEEEIEKEFAENEINLQREIEERRQNRKKKRKRERALFAIGAFLAVLLVFAVVTVIVKLHNMAENARIQREELYQAEINALIAQADFIAAGYDYDGAIEKIQSYNPDYAENQDLLNAVARYENAKQFLVPYENVKSITHVFFHTLIVDTSKAFDGDYKEAGYNQY
ncbi:MAG: hypothetical protein ACI3XA_01890, partial [Clostridia bacterium]